MPLSKKQRTALKALVHHLNPVVLVGQNGLTEAVIKEIGVALNDHELIKVRISGAERDEKQQMIEEIAAQTGSELVHTIGHTASFFRRHPKNAKITLPKD